MYLIFITKKIKKIISFLGEEGETPSYAMMASTHAPSMTRKSKGPRQHRIFLFTLARRTLHALLFPYREICTHNKLSQDPLFTLGRSDFATSLSQWSSVGLSKPRNLTTVNAGLLLSPFRIFPIAFSALAMSNNLSPRLPNPDFLKP
jgi:hypothetical protein